MASRTDGMARSVGRPEKIQQESSLKIFGPWSAAVASINLLLLLKFSPVRPIHHGCDRKLRSIFNHYNKKSVIMFAKIGGCRVSRRVASSGERFSEFIQAKQRASERIKVRHIENQTALTYRMKLRIRLASKLSDEVPSVKTSFLGRRVVIRSRVKGKLLSDDHWIIFVATRFKTIEKAVSFGIALQSTLAVAGAVTSAGMDVGADNLATTSFSDHLKEAYAKQGSFLIDDVHGVDVYPDTVTAFLLTFDANVSTSHTSSSLLARLAMLTPGWRKIDDKIRSAALMENAALMAGHPVAAITLAIGAVELLSAEKIWNRNQSNWIKKARQFLDESQDVNEDDKILLRRAINGMHNFGAKEKARRLLDRLDLSDIKERWSNLYDRRSQLVHGAEYTSYNDLIEMQSEAMDLSKKILVSYVEKTMKILITA